MIKKLFVLYALLTLILFSFAGCRVYRSAASEVNSMAPGLNSTVSGVVPKLESGGRVIQSQVSGVVSTVESRLA